MSNLTAERNTLEGLGRTITVTAGEAIYAGALVAVSGGLAIPAAASSCTVLGRAENTAASSGCVLSVKQGAFVWDNDTTSACSSTDVGQTCYVKDDHTVTMAGGTAAVPAGTILHVDNGGVMVKTEL